MFDKATAMMLASTALGGMFTVLACPGLYKGGGFLLCQIFYSTNASRLLCSGCDVWNRGVRRGRPAEEPR